MSSNYISEVLKTSRKGSNLSVNEVVDKLSSLYGIVVASKTLYGWEKSRSQPDIDTFLALCKIYNISNDDFLMIGNYLCDRESPTNPDESSQLLLSNYEQLNDEGKEKLISYSNDLVDTGRYLKENQSGLGEKKMA